MPLCFCIVRLLAWANNATFFRSSISSSAFKVSNLSCNKGRFDIPLRIAWYLSNATADASIPIAKSSAASAAFLITGSSLKASKSSNIAKVANPTPAAIAPHPVFICATLNNNTLVALCIPFAIVTKAPDNAPAASPATPRAMPKFRTLSTSINFINEVIALTRGSITGKNASPISFEALLVAAENRSKASWDDSVSLPSLSTFSLAASIVAFKNACFFWASVSLSTVVLLALA